MLYYLFKYLDENFDLIGAGVFQYLSFRAGLAVIFSLLISILFGKSLINLLQRQQVGEEIRDLGLDGQSQKAGTPTMGGVIIILSIVVPTLLLARLENVYIILVLLSILWMGAIGFTDDYIKVFKKDKRGLAGRFKVIGQISLGLLVGMILYFHEDVVIREFDEPVIMDRGSVATVEYRDLKTTKTNIPFFKENELDYESILPFLPADFTWIVYVGVVLIAVAGVSNGANITDGLDGLAAGSSAIIGLTLAIFSYLSGNIILSEYLNIMYIPNSGELVIFCAAFTGACVGFLWYNAFPAQVFMGDTGSLSLGAVIAVIALAIRKELLLPLLCGIFLIEVVSVMMQVGYFKYTRRKFGAGKRIFLMSPLHHHYQKKGYHESKIVIRFWALGILLAVLTLATLKLR